MHKNRLYTFIIFLIFSSLHIKSSEIKTIKKHIDTISYNELLLLGAQNNNHTMMKHALLKGASFLYKNKEHQNILHFLVTHRYSKKTQNLIFQAIKSGLNPHAQNKYGNSAYEISRLFQNGYTLNLKK